MGRPTRLAPWLLVLLVGLPGCGRPSTPPPSPPASVAPGPTAPAKSAPQPATPESAAPKPTVPAKQTYPALPGAIGIMVENSPGARPQTGLDRADLIFESESEYGVTRFLALFDREGPPVIGPVRSARKPFIEMATPYRVPYAHAGGSNEALSMLASSPGGLLNVDEIYVCGGCFWRSTDREAPHNLYTSSDRQVAFAKERSFALSTLRRFPEGNLAGGQPVVKIAYDWGQGTQDGAWQWDGQRYLRLQAGEPHLMSDGARLATDNLVLLFTRFVWRPDAQPQSGLYQIDVVGSGDGILYRDGKGWPIRWSKASRSAHINLTLPDGSPALLRPDGQTWVTYLKGPSYVRAGLLP
jgi:hypothetical protein